MKIIFLCGSSEPGRDGVGDYTRRLAEELIRQGHQAATVALNDRFIEKLINFYDDSNGVNMPVLRVPSTWSATHRFAQAKKWVDEFDPEWLSFQFVPYAYHSKGLALFLGIDLKMISGERRVHIMFHETWIGVRNRLEFKRIVTSTLQRLIIKGIIRILRPLIVHTHLPTFYFQLEGVGCKVRHLALFSNIKPLIDQLNYFESNILRVGFFSQFGSSDPIIKFLISLSIQSNKKGMKFEVLLIGGVDEQMRNELCKLEKVESLNGRIKYTGFLKPKELSGILGSCSLGITPIPRHALGKSGSVAAFLSHGIPVAAPVIHHKHKPSEIGFFSNSLRSAVVLEPKLQAIKIAKEAASKANEEILVHNIAHQFLTDFASIDN